MNAPARIVIDTNVLVAALRSRRGWSFELLSLVGTGEFEHVVTVPLVMEYEDVLHRPGMIPLDAVAIDDVLDYLCAAGVRQTIHFLWRPRLPDPRDDMVLEAAFNGQCTSIVTWNVRDFAGADTLGIQVVTPADWLAQRMESKK